MISVSSRYRVLEWMKHSFSCTFGKAMDGNQARGAIPSFLLYGEQAGGGEPPFIHIETIASRAGMLGWTIDAHRHDALSHVLLIKDGGGRFLLDGVVRQFGPGSAISVPSKLVHAFYFLPDTDGLVLTLSDSLLELATDALVESDLSNDLAGALLVDLAQDPDLFGQIAASLARISAELVQPQLGQLSAIRTHAALILLAMVRGGRFHGEQSAYSSQDLRLVEKLRRRIGQSLKEMPGVGDLAAELGVTAARLNAACRRWPAARRCICCMRPNWPRPSARCSIPNSRSARSPIAWASRTRPISRASLPAAPGAHPRLSGPSTFLLVRGYSKSLSVSALFGYPRFPVFDVASQ